jgi:MFS family permease
MFAAGLAILIAFLVRNSPHAQEPRRTSLTQGLGELGQGIRLALSSGEVWLIGAVAAAMCGPILSFGGLWGVPYFMTAYGLDRPQAAFLTSTGFIGWAIGAPAAGWLSDHVRRRKVPLIAGAAVLTVLLALLALVPAMPLWASVLITFGIGITGAHMSIAFALAREVTPPPIHGSVMGMVNAMTVGAGAVLQPTIGAILDWMWRGETARGVRIYDAADYRFAFLSLLVWSLAGLLLSVFLRETRCRPAARN